MSVKHRLALLLLLLLAGTVCAVEPIQPPALQWDANNGELHWQRNNDDPAIDYWLEISRRSDFATLVDSRHLNDAPSTLTVDYNNMLLRISARKDGQTVNSERLLARHYPSMGLTEKIVGISWLLIILLL